MGLGTFLLRQFAKPSGWAAPLTARFLNAGNRPLNADAITALEVQPGMRVLDVGFGGGGSLPELLRRAGEGLVAGVDPSPEMVDRARSLFAQPIAAGRLEIALGTVAALPWGPGSFDRVLTVNTITFWSDAAAGLREIVRVLAPDGALLLAIRTQRMLDRVSIESFGFHSYGEAELVALCEQAGLADLTVKVVKYRRGGDAALVRGRKP